MSIEVDASLAVQVGRLTDSVRTGFGLEWGVPITGSIVGDGGTDIAVLTGPQEGEFWEMRRISFGAPTTNASAITTPGTLLICRGSSRERWLEITRTTTVPNDYTWSHGQLQLRSPDRIVIVWIGGVGQMVIDGQAIANPLSGHHNL